MNVHRWRRVGCAVVLALACASAQAGRSCEQKKPTVRTIERGLTLAARTAQRLDETGAQVVVLARVGQDLSEYHLRYSHLGFAYRDGKTWRVLHKLNHCGAATASLYRQ